MIKATLSLLTACMLMWGNDNSKSNNTKHTALPSVNCIYADTAPMPACIQKLARPAGKGIRSSIGAMRYKNDLLLSNGKKLFVFASQASIGCNINEPAGTKYYNDSCKMVAYFPAGFSVNKGFRPFIARGYSPDDFPEASQGEYPAYFSGIEKTNTAKSQVSNPAPVDPFPTEKSFKIVSVKDSLLHFKTGDIILVSTKNGLKHFRNKQLMNTYKIIPQLTVIKIVAQCRVPPCPVLESRKLAYHLASAQRFINISNNIFFVSAQVFKDANTPNTAITTSWKMAYQLAPL